MLTTSILKQGEGVLEAFSLEIGRAHQGEKTADEDYRGEAENAFYKDFYQMADRVEKLFANYHRLAKKKTNKEKADDNDLEKGRDPSEPSSPPSSSSESSSIASSNPTKQPENAKPDLPYLKLDIKFDFPTYNGEVNA